MAHWRPTSRREFAVSFLSPVHVGTEETLGPHEVLWWDGRLWRFRTEPILRALEGRPPLLECFVEAGLEGIRDWLRQSRLWEEALVYACPLAHPPRLEREPLRPFLTDAHGRPYLPGTEVKGAIRTALAWQALNAGYPARFENLVGRRRERDGSVGTAEKQQAGQRLARALFGEEPHRDRLRALRVGDSTPAPASRLRVVRVLVAAAGPGGLRWLFRARRGRTASQYTQDPGCALGTFCECLDRAADGQLSLTVELDAYLAGEAISRELGWDRTSALAEEWGRACNEFARSVASGELAWWRKAENASLAAFYENLLQELQDPGENVYLNLGWGGGWRTKTVTEIFGEPVVERTVRQYGLARGGTARPFPKTRRVAWTDGAPVPLGWVKLTPAG